MSRSAAFHEVDDPADVRLGRAPGTYPNQPDFTKTHAEGTTVGQVGFESWTHNGFGAYFAAVQGTIRDVATGYLDLATVTGKTGRTRTGSSFEADDLIRHVRLHPSGTLEVGFETDPASRPAPLLLVRGDERLEGALRVDEALHVAGAVDVGALTVTASGGNVPHACALREAMTPEARVARVSCSQVSVQLAVAARAAPVISRAHARCRSEPYPIRGRSPAAAEARTRSMQSAAIDEGTAIAL